jgi:hypothetical protein
VVCHELVVETQRRVTQLKNALAAEAWREHWLAVFDEARVPQLI